MITPEWLEYKLNTLQVHKELQESILRDIVRRILKTNIVTDTAAWQTEKLQQAGMVFDDISKEVAKASGKTKAEIQNAFADAETEVFNYGDEVLETAGQDPIKFKSLSPKMKNIYKAALAKTTTEALNLTKTTANTAQTAFIAAADLAHMQIASGAFTYSEAIKNAVKSAARQGTTVVYPSGHISSLDAAMRRAVLTGINQTTGKLQEMRADDMECDIMEITAHSGARPSHALWQGQLVSRSGQKGYLSLFDIGYGTVSGFMGANCRHGWFIYFPGISKRNYTKEQLDKLADETVVYNEKQMPVWEARDMQRAMERSIKRYKQELVAIDEAMKNTIEDEEKLEWQFEFNNSAIRLKGAEAKLADFCGQTGLHRDRFREQVFATETENGIKNFGKSVSGKVVHANRKEIDKYTKYRYNKDGSIVVTDSWIGKDLHKIPDKYKPFAVVETLESKGGYYQHNLTYYNDKGLKCRQIHGGHHGMPKQHKFASGGEHQHFYRYKLDGKIGYRKTKKLTKKDRKECRKIL